jgi:Domain of unknown function (DUF4124)
MKRTSLVIFLGALLVSVAQATTYVRVEKDGTKTYSDRPLAGGHPVDVQPAQTYSAPSSSSSRANRPGEAEDPDEANFHYECSLTPRNDETFTNPESVSVGLTLSPGLRSGDTLTFTMDGVPLTGRGDGQTAFSVPQPDRGSHTVSARVVSRSGRSVCDVSITFHVLRPSINSPARRPPPPPPPRPTPH